MDWLTRITSPGGAPFSVATPYADRFTGFLSDLAEAGYAIDPKQSGGYNDRNIAGTDIRSRHADGAAIDLNWNDQPRGQAGTIPAELARRLAKKRGLIWGGDWKNPDPMHFEVARGGSTPLAERGVVSAAGLGGPPHNVNAAQNGIAAVEQPSLSKVLNQGPSAMPNDQYGNYIPEDTIRQRMSYANHLLTTPPGVGNKYSALTGAFEGLGGSLFTGMANRDLTSNQNMMSRALKGTLEAPDINSAVSTLVESGVPSLQTTGVEQKLKLLADDPYKAFRVRAALWKEMGYKPEDAGYKEWFFNGKYPGTDTELYGKAGSVFQDKHGKFYTVQFGANGERKILPVDGLTPARGVAEVDTGTGTEIIDKATGEPVRSVPKDIIGQEGQKVIGEGQGKAVVNLPTVEAAASRILKSISEVFTDTGLDKITGVVGGRIPEWAQTEDMARAQSRVDQITGGAFLTAYNDLRGGGAITEAEGSRATAAYARVKTQTMGSNDYRQALRDLRTEILRLYDVALVKAGQAPKTFTREAIMKFIDGAATVEPGAIGAEPAEPNALPPGWTMEKVIP